jgi:hypothetical protein
MAEITVPTGSLDFYSGGYTSGQLRFYATHPFTPSDGDPIPAGRVRSDNFCLTVPWTSSGGEINYDSFVIDSHTDAIEDANGSTYTIAIFGTLNGNHIYLGVLYRNIRVNETPLTQTLAEIIEFSAVSGAIGGGVAAGGVLSGTYPNPGFAVDMATQAELNAVAASIAGKQDALVSGTNIKTLDGQTLLGGGNIPVKTVGGVDIIGTAGDVEFKLINGNSVVGSGNINIAGGEGGGGGAELLLSQYTSLSDAVGTIGSVPATLVLDEDAVLDANIVIPATLTLKAINGNRIISNFRGPLISGVTNGDRQGLGWGTNDGGWFEQTSFSFPDWLVVEFDGEKTITEIDVVTLQDNFVTPIEPTLLTPFTLYGITEFDVQYWDGADWVTVPGGAIVGNDKVWRQITFPAVSTTKIRILIHDSVYPYSLLVEVEAWGGGVNHALSSNGGWVTASSSAFSESLPSYGIEFEGLGLVDPESQTPLFEGFDDNGVQWTGIAPLRVSSNLWADEGLSERLNHAITALAGKNAEVIGYPGTTEASATIEDPVDILEGTTVYLTAGDYYLNHADTIAIRMESFTTLYGDGIGKTNIHESANGTNSQRSVGSSGTAVNPFNTLQTDIHIRDLSFIGNPDTSFNSSASSVHIGNVHRGRIDRCSFYQTHGFAVFFGSFSYDEMHQANGCWMTECIVDGLGTQYCGTIGGMNIFIDRNVFLVNTPIDASFTAVVDIEPNSNTIGSENVHITNNIFDGRLAQVGWNGVAVQKAYSGHARNIRVANNTFISADGTQRQFRGSTDVNLATNTISLWEHGFQTGQSVGLLGSSLPAPLVGPSDNAIVIAVTPHTFQLADTYADAYAGIPLDLTTTGSDDIHITPIGLMANGIQNFAGENVVIENNTFSTAGQFAISCGLAYRPIIRNNAFLSMVAGIQFDTVIDALVIGNHMSLKAGETVQGTGSSEVDGTWVVATTAGSPDIVFSGEGPLPWFFAGQTLIIAGTEYIIYYLLSAAGGRTVRLNANVPATNPVAVASMNWTDTRYIDNLFPTYDILPASRVMSSAERVVAPTATPALITANQDNYNPGSVAYRWDLSTNASRNITGINLNLHPNFFTHLEGQQHVIYNAGSFDIVLKHEDAGSTAEYRFKSTTGADITLAPGQGAEIQRNNTIDRWLVFPTGVPSAIPYGAAPTVDADGEIAIETTIADMSHGLIKYFSGEELAVIAVPIAELTGMADGDVIKYNAANEAFELGAGGGVSGLGGTDNVIPRTVGTGGNTLEGTAVVIDDANHLGVAQATGGIGGTLSIFNNSDSDTGLAFVGSNQVIFMLGGVGWLGAYDIGGGSGVFAAGNGSQYTWNSSNQAVGAGADTGLGRNAAGVIKATDGGTGIRGFIGGGAAVASAAALPLPTGRVFHVTGTTNITSITATNLAAGVVITLIFDDVLTFTDGNNLKLAGNFVTSADDTITLAFDGTNFYETARSVN